MIALTSPSPSPPTSQVSPVSNSVSMASEVLNEETSLSRNTSVISTASSSSSSSSSVAPPPRPRPIRTYTGPQAKNVPDGLPASPTTPKATQRNFEDYLRGGTPPGRSSPALNNVNAQIANSIVHSANGLTVPTPIPLSNLTSGLSTPIMLPSPGTSTPNGARSRHASQSNSAQNYRFEGLLGEGSYSTVHRATSIVNGQTYAIKIMIKVQLQRENKVRYANTERTIMSKLGAANHPGIIRLYSAFQDKDHLYFVMELAPKGELFSQIRRLGSFNLECTRYYAATILDAVSFIHSMNIIHRDLKPENILLDMNMRIRITDFGSAKDKSIAVVTTSEQARKGSFVGTPEYASPEMLVPPTITTRASDIWAFGCIVFQFISGRPPFKGGTAYLTMKKIQECDYTFPDGFDPVVRTLVERCLVNNPTVRITSGELRNHPFFSPVDWDTLWKQTPPTLQPGLVIAPEEVEQDLKLDLTWTIDGSENEMEDLRPHADKGAHHAHLVAEVTASMAQDLTINEPHSRTPQAATGPEGLQASSNSSNVKKKSRRFSHPSVVERTPVATSAVAAAKLSLLDDPRHKVRRASLNSDYISRPRRASPSSIDGKPSVNAHRLQEEEEDDTSEMGSGEGPPSTSEQDELQNTSAQGGGNTLHPHPGHAKGLSLSSSMDTTLMSTSGTSAASRSSGNFNNGTSGPSSSRGFEVVRGGKGVELGTGPSTESSTSKTNWIYTNGQPMLRPSETVVFQTPVTTKLKRGILPAKQRRRSLVLTSEGRLICIKELKSSTGRKKAQLEEELVVKPTPSRDIEKVQTGEKAASMTTLEPQASISTPASSNAPSTSPSKRSSIIGISLPSGSSITSALPNILSSGQTPNQPTASSSTSLTPVDRANAITKVEVKGDTGFTIYVGERVSTYNVESSAVAKSWVEMLTSSMEDQKGSPA
ncbi:kinase-like protein [Serendipita vermifera]|nr:kinase-like protein [Serendipita vermifera]